MRKHILNLLDVKTTHDFGIVDRFQDGWDNELKLEAESYDDRAFLRIQLFQSKRGSTRSVGFAFCTSADSHFSARNAIQFFQQIERCWQGKNGKPYQQSRFSRFIDRKLFGLEIVRVLDEIPTAVHDPYAIHKLECQRHTNGREVCMLHHQGRNRDVTGSIIGFPRSSVEKIITTLERYPL